MWGRPGGVIEGRRSGGGHGEESLCLMLYTGQPSYPAVRRSDWAQLDDPSVLKLVSIYPQVCPRTTNEWLKISSGKNDESAEKSETNASSESFQEAGKTEEKV